MFHIMCVNNLELLHFTLYMKPTIYNALLNYIYGYMADMYLQSTYIDKRKSFELRKIITHNRITVNYIDI